jgi:C-terminal lipocalin-like domain
MKWKALFRNAIASSVAAAFVLALMSAGGLAASEFVGTWKVQDKGGKPFEITLSADGTAKSTMGDSDSGTWKEEGGAAVITWNSGWTAKITKDGDKYQGAAWKKGQSLDKPPTNKSEAEKVS